MIPPKSWHYDHKKKAGPYGVCRLCGREHDLKKDVAEAATTPRMTIEGEEDVSATQHRRPCHDCPWRRSSIPGWTGAVTVENWIEAAMSDAKVACHTKVGLDGKPHQCAGIAIYRANVCKLPRDPEVMRLPPDHEAVFGFNEFQSHHGLKRRGTT